MARTWMLMVFSLFLVACETPTTQRYAVSADNNQFIRALQTSGVGVDAFTGPASFDPKCRGYGPMEIADGLTHTQYIQKAFVDELKFAGVYAATPARVTLEGRVDQLSFSSSHSVTKGFWIIDLTLKSSNGGSIGVSEHYDFKSGFGADAACRNTAEAFSRAVQDLVSKSIADSRFPALLK